VVLPARFEPLTWRGEPCQGSRRLLTKKGFLVFRLITTMKGYRRQLRRLLAEHHTAFYRAVLYSEVGSIEEQLAEFLIEEAGYTVEEFVQLHIRGEFDE
jgi:hypothetical protein